MKRFLNSRSKKKSKLQRYGRIRPFLLSVFIVVSGLLLDKEWWKIGIIALIALFIGGYYRYRTPH